MVATVRSRTASSESLSQTKGKQLMQDCAGNYRIISSESHNKYLQNPWIQHCQRIPCWLFLHFSFAWGTNQTRLSLRSHQAHILDQSKANEIWVKQKMSNNYNWSIRDGISHLENAVVAIFLLGEDFESLLFITRSYDSIRHLRVHQIIATWIHQSGIKCICSFINLSWYNLGGGNVTHIWHGNEVSKRRHPVRTWKCQSS